VAPANDEPTATNDAAVTKEDTTKKIAVLNNDTDVDGDTLMVIGTSTPAHGIVVVNPDNTIRYVPDANYNGSDTFTYSISDGRGATANGVVSVSITPVNDKPVANDDVIDSAVVVRGMPETVAVLANDTDVDGDKLTVVAASRPEHGSVTINADSTITYTPAGFGFYDSFVYTVSDGNGGRATAIVRVYQ
jgi:hypothetical protein